MLHTSGSHDITWLKSKLGLHERTTLELTNAASTASTTQYNSTEADTRLHNVR